MDRENVWPEGLSCGPGSVCPPTRDRYAAVDPLSRSRNPGERPQLLSQSTWPIYYLGLSPGR